MHSIDTQIEVTASAARVWSILMNFAGYAGWNPFIRSIEGAPTVGASLNVFIQPLGSRGMRFRPQVLAIEPTREFRWKGKLVMRGLFDGEHYFIVEPSSDARSVFRQGEIFTGLLVPLFRRSLDGDQARFHRYERSAEGRVRTAVRASETTVSIDFARRGDAAARDCANEITGKCR